MKAFNRRLEPKEISGMPLEGAVCLVLSLILLTITLITPGLFRILPGLLLVASLTGAVISFVFRAKLPFLIVIFQGRFLERGRVTTETRTRL